MNRRGQTMVLFAFTLMALVVMVLITIGLGVRIHERQEQQIVADAAAYSSAVLTARSFNAVAVLNRTIISQMTSVAAAQSLLSYAGFYHGTLNQARDALNESIKPGYPIACRDEIADARTAITKEDYDLITKWEPAGGGYHGANGMDSLSGHYVDETLHTVAVDISKHQRGILEDLDNRVAPEDGIGVAERIANRARKGSPWRTEEKELFAGKQPVTRHERDRIVLPEQKQPHHMVAAAMGVRGLDPFISARRSNHLMGELSGADYIIRRINFIVQQNGSPLVASMTSYGTSYFGSFGPGNASEQSGLDGQQLDIAGRWQEQFRADNPNVVHTGAWATDSGRFTFTWPNAPPGCALPNPTDDSFGYIVSTLDSDHNDNHMWRRGYGFDYREKNDPGHVNEPPHIRHTLRSNPGNGLSIWPVFVDMKEGALEDDFTNPSDGPVNVHGVPKSMVPILRDYSQRATPDPWEFNFTINFGGSPATIDLRAGREFTNSSAIASGLTYYRRGAPGGVGGAGHGKEPPNFLNPFWRATLAASDVDERHAERGKDVADTLRANGRFGQAALLEELRENGFRAIP